MTYCDTSLIVASLTQEPHTTAANKWLSRQLAGSLTISPWVAVEIASALSQKVRTREITVEHRLHLGSVWRDLATKSFTIIPTETAHFDLAARYLDDHKLGLRAGDALHLAIAGAVRESIATLDDRMIAAANALGIAYESIRTPA